MPYIDRLGYKHISLYDICGEDHYVLANLEKDGDVTIQVLDEEDREVFNEKSHIAAWDSLVSFATMVLEQNKKIQRMEKSCDAA